MCGASSIGRALHVDSALAAVMSHSYGAVTTGGVVTADARFIAALAIAALISILGGTRPADIDTPFLLPREDNSITETGNGVIRNDYRRLGGRAWLIEVDDAGHFSFSNIAAIGGDRFLTGCGMGTRQTTPHGAFTYVDNALARDLAADIAAGFFAVYLLDDPGGATFPSRLDAPTHVVRR